MCGLVGIASTEKFVDREQRGGILEEMLVLSAFRGWESTGIAAVELGKEKELPVVYKRALTASDFITSHFFQKQVVRRMDDYSIVMGHNRSSTRGAVTNRNAHPFQHGSITLTHNGTIENIGQLMPITADTPNNLDVDSDKLTWLMNQEGDEETLAKCTGAYALVWHDAADGTLNFVKNDRKPIFWAFLKGKNTMLWASEPTTILHVCERRNLAIERPIYYPKSHSIITFDVNKMREFTTRPFVPAPLNNGGPRGRRFDTGRDDITIIGVRDPRLPWHEGLRTLREAEETRHAFKEAAKSDKGLRNPGRPTKLRKIRKAEQDVALFGYKLGEATKVLPFSWTAYKNQQGRRGLLLGETRNGIPVCMYNITAERYRTYVTQGYFWGEIVNVASIESNKKAMVVVEHPKWVQKLFHGEKEAAKEELPRRPTDDSALGPVERVFQGPGGQLVSADRFHELTRGNCGSCTGVINIRDHEQLIWVGEPPHESPICVECQANDEVMEHLGLAKQKVH